MKYLLLSALLLSGCASTKQLPPPIATLDVYLTEEGFIVVVERGTDNTLAVRFNAQEIHRND